TRDHLGVAERLRPGDMVEVPVAQDDREAASACVFEDCANPACVLDRHVRVVHERGVTGDDRVARDPERDRRVFDPRRLSAEALAVTSGIEGVDARRRLEQPQHAESTAHKRATAWEPGSYSVTY